MIDVLGNLIFRQTHACVSYFNPHSILSHTCTICRENEINSIPAFKLLFVDFQLEVVNLPFRSVNVVKATVV